MMNLKYYLRGLGIGIIVTALIMSIVSGGKESLSNAEIKERARALGMIEGGTLIEDAQTALNTISDSDGEAKEGKDADTAASADDKENHDQAPEEGQQSEEPQSIEDSQHSEEGEPQPSGEGENAEGPLPLEESEDAGESQTTEEPEAEEVTQPLEEPENEETAFGGRDENVTIRVNRGEGSYTVCKRLEEAGLIESASEFDNYLYQNGYDKKIRAGSFEIPAGAGASQIAGILIGTQ